jgi:hypothetical protein
MTKKLTQLFVALALTALAGTAFAQGQALRILPDAFKGYASYFVHAPVYVDERVLAANVSETHTIPTAADGVVFSSNCAEFRAKLGASASITGADVSDGTAAFINPAQWFVGNATQLTLIAPSACTISLAWFRLRP